MSGDISANELEIKENEVKELKNHVSISYSIEKADSVMMSEYEVKSGDIKESNGTQYFSFSISQFKTVLEISKRFDEFRILHEEMEKELLDIDKCMTILPSGYHILPILPPSGITKVTQNNN